MTYLTDLQPFAIRSRNEEVLEEVSKQRLEKRLRDNRQPRSGRAYALILRAADAAAALSETCGEACFTYSLRAGREGAPNRQIR
jgi:hypothetical protein